MKRAEGKRSWKLNKGPKCFIACKPEHEHQFGFATLQNGSKVGFTGQLRVREFL